MNKELMDALNVLEKEKNISHSDKTTFQKDGYLQFQEQRKTEMTAFQ